MSRTDLLIDLVDFARPVDETIAKLNMHSWDSEEELVELTDRHLAAVISRYNIGEITTDSIEAWANAIECRDDISYKPESNVGLVLHELANPHLTQPLGRKRAMALLSKING